MRLRMFLAVCMALIMLVASMLCVGILQGWSRVDVRRRPSAATVHIRTVSRHSLPLTDDLDCPYKLEPA